MSNGVRSILARVYIDLHVYVELCMHDSVIVEQLAINNQLSTICSLRSVLESTWLNKNRASSPSALRH